MFKIKRNRNASSSAKRTSSSAKRKTNTNTPSPSRMTGDAAFYKERDAKIMEKYRKSRANNLFTDPENDTYLRYPEEGPNALMRDIHEFNTRMYLDPMELAEREKNGLTFGGRRRRRRRRRTRRNGSLKK